MKFLRAVWRFFVGLRDRILWIINGIFGPPIAALRCLLAAMRDRFDALVGRLLEWWSNIFAADAKLPSKETSPPAKCCMLVAAAALGLAVFTWPNEEHLTNRQFLGLSAVVWLTTWLSTRYLSRPDRIGPVGRWLREADRRVGLRRWEQAGAAISLVIIWISRVDHHRLAVLGLVLLAGFLKLLGTHYAWRELGFVRRQSRRLLDSHDATPDEDGFVQRTFTWLLARSGGDRACSITVAVSQDAYDVARSVNPSSRWSGDLPALAEWVTAASPDVDRAASQLARLSTELSLSTFAEITAILGFAQSVNYALDVKTTGVDEYWRFPVETLYEQTGDCEDSSILAAAVLRRLGHRVALAVMDEHAAVGVEAPPGTPGHFALVEGRRMYYCETTASGFHVGQVPEDVEPASIRWMAIP